MEPLPDHMASAHYHTFSEMLIQINDSSKDVSDTDDITQYPKNRIDGEDRAVRYVESKPEEGLRLGGV